MYSLTDDMLSTRRCWASANLDAPGAASPDVHLVWVTPVTGILAVVDAGRSLMLVSIKSQTGSGCWHVDITLV